MADGGFTADVVYGRGGVVLHTAACSLAGQTGSGGDVWSGPVRVATDGEYFFGGSNQDDRFVSGGGSSGICNDYVDGIFAV